MGSPAKAVSGLPEPPTPFARRQAELNAARKRGRGRQFTLTDDSLSETTPGNPLPELRRIENQIRAAESTSLRERWESGRLLVGLRQGGQRLPNRLADELTEVLKVSTAELIARMKFATKYPTETELTNALVSFPSWHALVNVGLRDRRDRPRPLRSPEEALTAHMQRLLKTETFEPDTLADLLLRLADDIRQGVIQ